MIGFVHSKLVESLLRGLQRIAFQFSALNVDANLSRRFRFCLPESRSQFGRAQVFWRNSLVRMTITSSSRRRHRRNYRRRH